MNGGIVVRKLYKERELMVSIYIYTYISSIYTAVCESRWLTSLTLPGKYCQDFGTETRENGEFRSSGTLHLLRK
jgi:hypothetical protein